MYRFFAPDLPHEGGTCTLPEDEARHLTQVLRMKRGDRIRVFDGGGREHEAEVIGAARRNVTLLVGSAVPAAPEPAAHVTVAAAVLKAEKFDTLVRDAVMIGAWQIQPLLADRSEMPRVRAEAAYRSGRWQRIAIGSAKQSGRAVVPEVRQPLTLIEALRELPRPLIVLAEPSAATPAVGGFPAPEERATLMSGPEGGWCPAELAAVTRAGARFVRFGARTLRADAAPVVGLALLLHDWNAL